MYFLYIQAVCNRSGAPHVPHGQAKGFYDKLLKFPWAEIETSSNRAAHALELDVEIMEAIEAPAPMDVDIDRGEAEAEAGDTGSGRDSHDSGASWGTALERALLADSESEVDPIGPVFPNPGGGEPAPAGELSGPEPPPPMPPPAAPPPQEPPPGLEPARPVFVGGSSSSGGAPPPPPGVDFVLPAGSSSFSGAPPPPAPAGICIVDDIVNGPTGMSWGVFRFTRTKGSKYGGYQVSCPYHNLSSITKSGCKRRMAFEGPEMPSGGSRAEACVVGLAWAGVFSAAFS